MYSTVIIKFNKSTTTTGKLEFVQVDAITN